MVSDTAFPYWASQPDIIHNQLVIFKKTPVHVHSGQLKA